MIEIDLNGVEVPEGWVYEVGGKKKADDKKMQYDIKKELKYRIGKTKEWQDKIMNHPFLGPWPTD